MAWSVTNHSVDRVTRGSLFCRDLAISIFGAMTPGPFERYMQAAGGDGADGFLQRLQLMVYPDPPKEWRAVDRRPEGAAEERAPVIMSVYLRSTRTTSTTGRRRCTAHAQEVFDRWIEALEHQLRDQGPGPASRDVDTSRSTDRSRRRSRSSVTWPADRARGSARYPRCDGARGGMVRVLDAHADRVYSMARCRVDRRRDRAADPAGKIKPGVIPVRDIQRMLPGSVKAAEVEAACEVLEEHGWLVLEEVRKASRGRPSLVAHINPKGAAETSPEEPPREGFCRFCQRGRGLARSRGGEVPGKKGRENRRSST